MRFRYVIIAPLLLAAMPLPARAFDTMVGLVPNPVTAENGSGQEAKCITCHNNPDGGSGCAQTGGQTPCLNPFGLDFSHSEIEGTADRTWTPVLAFLDSDGDGFTNGQELQDLEGTWLPGRPNPGYGAQHTPPGNAKVGPGTIDADGDGYCVVGHDLDHDGDCTGPDENDGGHDCFDDDAELNSEAEEICNDRPDNDCDSLTNLDDPQCGDYADRDRDGFCPKGVDANGDGDCIDRDEDSQETQDCADLVAAVFPGAHENCIDERDNDCNAEIDLYDEACTSTEDVDGDGYCPYGADKNHDGDCLDADETDPPVGDCHDGDDEIGPQAVESCADKVDNDCDGRSTFEDDECRHLADRDADGYCPEGRDADGDGNCAGADEDSGSDCNDEDPFISPEAEEVCIAIVDADCDELEGLDDPDCVRFTDEDGDGYCAAGEDLDDDGGCISNLETTGFSDCDDALRVIAPGENEVCTDQRDNDCDGSRDARDPECREYSDNDGDGRCLIGIDRNADADCSDDGEQNAARADCDGDMDATVYLGAGEHCFDDIDNDCSGERDLDDPGCRNDVDADSDGYCPVGRDLSEPLDGDCKDRGENFRLSDCNDGDPGVHPGLGENCKDHVDNDCDALVDLADESCVRVRDQDQDGYCPQGEDKNSDGDCIDDDEMNDARDCDDLDGTRRPAGMEICDNQRDDDCDFLTDAADRNCPCADSAQCVHGLPCFEGSCRSNICIYESIAECVPPVEDAGTPRTDGGGGDGEPVATGDGSAGSGSGSSGCSCTALGAATKPASLFAWAGYASAWVWFRRSSRRRRQYPVSREDCRP